MNDDTINIIEALLFASPEPLTQKKINIIFDVDSPDLVEKYFLNVTPYKFF